MGGTGNILPLKITPENVSQCKRAYLCGLCLCAPTLKCLRIAKMKIYTTSLTGPVFICKLLLNGASQVNKIGCIRLVWAGAKKYKFSFLLCADPLISIINLQFSLVVLQLNLLCVALFLPMISLSIVHLYHKLENTLFFILLYFIINNFLGGKLSMKCVVFFK